MSEARTIEDILREPGSTSEIQRAVDALDRRDATRSVRVHVLRNFTIENGLTALRFAGYRRDVRIDASLSGFDTYEQEAIDGSDTLIRADAVALFLWLEAMPMAWRPSGELDVAAARDQVFGVLDLVTSKTSAPVYVHTFVAPLGEGPAWEGHDALDALNLALRERGKTDRRVRVVDVARLSADLGRADSLDARFALSGAAPLSQALCRAWGEALATALARSVGHVKKVVCVDADDTLWGGVVGEDGPRGIRLSAHRYPGNAYHAFQRQLLRLRDRGVLLALASKNEPDAVLEILDRHDGCLLRRQHFAAMRIGWGPKSESLRSMAEELKIGLDAFVFVDDSAVECAEVASALPMVEVLRMPKEASRVPFLLAGVADLADRSSTTDEDRARAQHYDAEREREQARARHQDLDSFLASLELEATLGPPTPDEIERVAQLTQRTNQFNLTTIRYQASDIEAMLASGRFVVTALRAKDRFGDYGLTGLAIAEVESPRAARVDSVLMSCRTLGRRLEDALHWDLCERIAAVAPRAEIRAEYRPTKKNAQVADFFVRRGFRRVDETALRTTFVRAEESEPPNPPRVIRIRRIP